jgi:hypothetical protein
MSVSVPGYCAKCKEHFAYIVPLHGDKGGPLCCLTCVGAWNAEHGRKRNRGRVAIRAMKNFLNAGGKITDLEKLKDSAVLRDVFFGIDPLGYLHGLNTSDTDEVELTLELLSEVLVLVHPVSDRLPGLSLRQAGT